MRGRSASPPTRGRGLKPLEPLTGRDVGASPPTRGRGLKLEDARAEGPRDERRPPRGGVD